MKIWIMTVWVVLGLNVVIAQEIPISKALTETVECVSDLMITKFQLKPEADINITVNRLPFKVVFGRKIDYKARPKKNGISYDWDVGRYDSLNVFKPYLPFAVSPVNPIPFKDKGVALLPETALPVENSKLGYDTSGVVRVIKHLEVGNEVAYSTDTLTLPNVGFFFEKHSPSIHDPSVPNWFYYWSQIEEIQNMLELPGIKLFNTDICAFDSLPTPIRADLEYNASFFFDTIVGGSATYGNSSLSFRKGDKQQGVHFICPNLDTSLFNRPVKAYNDSTRAVIRIGKACSYFEGFYTIVDNPNSPTDTIRGINVFYSTMAHEAEHLRIECEVWAEGYDGFKDADNDGYNDDWEDMINGTEPYSGFTTGGDPTDPSYINDSYESGYNIDSLFLPNSLDHVGTQYEEFRCRTVSLNLHTSGDLINIDQYDWSFDPRNNNQGKNWKK